MNCKGYMCLCYMLQDLLYVQGVEVAIRLLQMTAAAGHFLQENRLYKSFRLLQRVKEALPGPKEEEDHHSRCCLWLHLQPHLIRLLPSLHLVWAEPTFLGHTPRAASPARKGDNWSCCMRRNNDSDTRGACSF